MRLVVSVGNVVYRCSIVFVCFQGIFFIAFLIIFKFGKYIKYSIYDLLKKNLKIFCTSLVSRTSTNCTKPNYLTELV